MSEIIPQHVATLVNIALTCSYVGFLYLIPGNVRVLPRNNPIHVRWRMGVILVTTVLLTVATSFFFSVQNYRLPGDGFFSSIGFRTNSLPAIILTTISLMMIFYIGPLVALVSEWVVSCLYEVDTCRHALTLRSSPRSIVVVVREHLNHCWASECKEILLRNLIVAPITEEIVFRGLIIVVSVASHCLESNGTSVNMRFSSLTVALLCPVYFSIAHFHHMYEQIRTGTAVMPACGMTAVQMTYTSIFGVIAGILLVRTGSVVSCIISHIICNTMGLPDISFVSEPKPGNFAHSRYFFMYGYRWGLLVLHAMGLIVFSYCLFPLTEGFTANSPLWIQ